MLETPIGNVRGWKILMKTEERALRIDINSIADAMAREYASQLLKEGKIVLDMRHEIVGDLENLFVKINVAVEG